MEISAMGLQKDWKKWGAKDSSLHIPKKSMSRLISVVVPMYREEKNIAQLIAALDQIAESESTYRWEYILVNDGSPDGTISILEKLSLVHPRCRTIDLSRNFGKEAALTAGLEFAQGSAIICMDADLQHPPKYIPSFLRLWEQGIEVVSAVRKKSEKQTLFRNLSSHLFYWIMENFTELEMASQTTDFRLLDRKVVNAMAHIGERQRIFRGLVDWLGFRRAEIEFEATERMHGEAGYSLSKLIQLAVNSFVSYSTFPLKLVGIIGSVISISSGTLLTWMLIDRFVFGDHVNFSPLAIFTVGNTFLFGVVVSMMGLVSLYIRKIYGETLNRPLFVVRNLHGFEKESDKDASEMVTSEEN